MRIILQICQIKLHQRFYTILLTLFQYKIQSSKTYQMRMNPTVAVIAMINGMIGGLILVLPILAMEAGYILSPIVIVVTGFFSFYSCYLCIIHLGSHSDLDKAVFYHFWQSKAVKVFYDFLVFINLVFILLLYFSLIVQQWQGLVGNSIAQPIANAVALLILVCVLKKVHFGAELLGYGIISIICYLLFLIWLIASAPHCCTPILAFGTGSVPLAASMGQAFSIQTFFIPVLRQLSREYQGQYTRYTLIAYIIGGLAYLYIAMTGSYGIVNRPIRRGTSPATTIEDYFYTGQWEVAIVQVIYLIHLYSAYGQFLLVSMKRFFGILNTICGIKHSKQGEFFTIGEMLYVFVVIVITMISDLLNVPIKVLIEINGAIIGFFFIYFIPAAMHFKCLYFTQNRQVIQIKYRASENFNTKNYQMTEVGNVLFQRDNKSVQGVQAETFSNKYNNLTNFNNQNVINGLNQPLNNYIIAQQNLNEFSSFNSNKATENTPKQGIIVVEDSVATSIQGDPRKQLTVQTMSVECTCRKSQNVGVRILDTFSVFIMVLLGLFIMVNGFISVINGTQ